MNSFPLPFAILVIQCIGTLALLKVGFRFFSHLIGKEPQYERGVFIKFIFLTFQFAVMLLSSLLSLSEVSVPTFIVIRNLATLVTAGIEANILGRRILLKEACSVLFMLFGALSYAYNDIFFTAIGYKFLIINVIFSSTYQVYVKTLVRSTSLSPWAMSYYNNLISVIMFVPFFYLRELSHLSGSITTSLSTKCLLLISSFAGFCVSITGFVLNRLVSPTAIMIINNVNKFLLIIVNEIVFGRSQNMRTIASSVVVISSGFWYSLERKRNGNMTSEEAILRPRKCRTHISGICILLFFFVASWGRVSLPVSKPVNSKSSTSSASHESNFLSPKLYGILEVKDDRNIRNEWFERHLQMFDGIVVFDGSTTDEVKEYVRGISNVIYTHEKRHKREYFTDSEHRGIALGILNAKWGTNNWVMICHSDSFYYHDPRSMALLAEKDGADHISWFALHILPHPTEFKSFTEHPEIEIHKKFRHYHWYGPSKNGTFQEHRMFKNGAHLNFGVDWCSGPPMGVKRLWDKHPAYLHYKITEPSLSNYDENGRHKSHFQGVKLSKNDPFYKSLTEKTKSVEMPGVGVSWHIASIEDFFVDKYIGKPKYKVCTKFDGTLPVQLDQFSQGFKAKPGILEN
jgi:drug/metabolite transporter (DMT)-like permease